MTSWVILLIIASIGLALFNLASNINTFFFLNIRRASSVYDSFLAQYFLSHFFFAFTFLCVIYVVSNTAIILGYANNQAANRAAPEDAGAIGAVPAVHDGAVPVATPAVHGESKDYYAPTPEMHNVPPYQQVPPQGQPPMQQGQHYPPPPPPQGQPLQQPGQHYPTPPPPQTYY